MERVIEYSRPINGLDYHNSPLIGEIATSDYTYYRSIDQLRTTINEREVLQTITSPHASMINGSVSLIPTTASTTDLRALDFNHKHYPSSVGRINGLHEIEVQPIKSVPHQQQLLNSAAASDRVNNNNNNNLSSESNNHHQTTHHHHHTNFTKEGKGNRKSRKNNRGAQQPPSCEVGGLVAQPGYNYQNQQVQSYAPSHSTHNQLQLSHHSPVLDGSAGSGVTSMANNVVTVTTANVTATSTATDNNVGGSRTNVIDNENNGNVSDEAGYIGGGDDGDEVDEDGETKESKIFTSKADLQLHTQVHMREAKPYKCSQCAKAFANSSYLSQHTRIHLGIKPYRCEICQRKFTQLSHLQQHIRTHTGDKPYKCRHPNCTKAFSQLSNLQSHSRCHQTDKPFKCNSCYKCFSDEPSLLEHIPKHKESKHLKTHICQYCGKSYTQETYLTKHMQKHAERTDKRPPISATSTTTSNTVSSSNTNKNLTLNTPVIPPMSACDHPYWPKVSPDSAANLNELMQHQQNQQQQQQNQGQQSQNQPQQQQQQPQSHHEFSLNNHPGNGHPDIQSHHRGLIDGHHREDVEDLAMNRQNSSNGHMNGQMPPSSTPSMSVTPSSYDTTKTTSNSAFTPINAMPPHLNSLGHHHQLGQRPYLYDAIGFSNKNVAQNSSNSFPNQLISLHQIRNYAHQPGGLMTGEHLLSGVTVGPGKDKG